jgi:hypothetical protein
MLGLGTAVRLGFGLISLGPVCFGKAVMFRCGEIGSGQVRFVMARGAVRFGRVRRVGAHKRYGPAWFLILT